MYDVLGIRTSVGGPIRVDGRLWGALSAHSTGPWPLAPEAATRITDFAELVATAISNAHARTEARRLADEQAALRRVATLVARQAEPAEIFTTVAEEVTRVLPVDDAWVIRYEPGETATIVGGWGRLRGKLLLGSSLDLEGDSVSARVYRTQQPVRAELAQAGGNLAAYVRSLGVGLSIGTPILVDRRLWGAMIAAWRDPEQAAPGIESRILEFTELVATALANVEARAALAASRERILLATDEARRRFERDLHDGAQQRLVALGAELRATAERAPPDKRGQLSGVADGIVAVIDELRELSRGLHPSILSEGGLRPALLALARRSAVTVRLDAELEGRFEERVEVAAYYVVSEALTNAAKHADATIVDIHVAAAEGLLAITIRDDGAGGADPSRGSGLLGLIDRVEALGGRAEIESPPGAGTSIHVQLPG
jgi:signal transduction histidine kinase